MLHPRARRAEAPNFRSDRAKPPAPRQLGQGNSVASKLQLNGRSKISTESVSLLSSASNSSHSVFL